MFHRLAIILAFAACLATEAGAQTFIERLQKPVKNQGTVTVHQDAAIDALVNGPWTPAPAPAQKPKKAEEGRPATKTATGGTTPGGATRQTASDGRAATKATEGGTTAGSADTATDTAGESADTRMKVMRNSYKVMGFRVQAFAGGNSRNDKLKAQQVGDNIKANIPGEPVYVHFYSPRWICRVGNYRTYEEAHQMLLAIRKLGYTQATIVKGKITVQY